MYNKKYALITGASGLLGPEHAAALAEIGFNLILIDINQKQLKEKSKHLKKKFYKQNILEFVCDITSEKQVKNLLKKLTKKRYL